MRLQWFTLALWLSSEHQSALTPPLDIFIIQYKRRCCVSPLTDSDCKILHLIHQIFTGNTLTTRSDRKKYSRKIIYDRKLAVCDFTGRGLFSKWAATPRAGFPQSSENFKTSCLLSSKAASLRVFNFIFMEFDFCQAVIRHPYCPHHRFCDSFINCYLSYTRLLY